MSVIQTPFDAAIYRSDPKPLFERAYDVWCQCHDLLMTCYDLCSQCEEAEKTATELYTSDPSASTAHVIPILHDFKNRFGNAGNHARMAMTAIFPDNPNLDELLRKAKNDKKDIAHLLSELETFFE